METGVNALDDALWRTRKSPFSNPRICARPYGASCNPGYGRPALAFAFRSADIGAGGWRWTSHSPTGSGPEGSSPNELRFGSLVSLPLNSRAIRIESPRGGHDE